MLKTKTLTMLAFAALVVGALFVAACSSSDVKEEDIDAANTRITALEGQTTKGQILAWRNAMRAEPLHDIDEALQASDDIDESWIGSATRAREATLSVTWPDDMADAAARLVTNLTTLEDALTDGDADAAGPAATATHDEYHDLDHEAGALLSGEEHADEHDDGEETSGTPAASAAH